MPTACSASRLRLPKTAKRVIQALVNEGPDLEDADPHIDVTDNIPHQTPELKPARTEET